MSLLAFLAAILCALLAVFGVHYADTLALAVGFVALGLLLTHPLLARLTP